MSCLVHSSFFPTKEDHPFPPKQRQFRSTSWQEPSGKLGLSINTGSFYRSFFLFKLDFHLENFYHNSVTMIKSLPSFISFVSINAISYTELSQNIPTKPISLPRYKTLDSLGIYILFLRSAFPPFFWTKLLVFCSLWTGYLRPLVIRFPLDD